MLEKFKGLLCPMLCLVIAAAKFLLETYNQQGRRLRALLFPLYLLATVIIFASNTLCDVLGCNCNKRN